jgi:hypothetical protein
VGSTPPPPHPNSQARVSFETSFVSKQPKLVSVLSQTKHLFWLFRFYIETESFNVSIEPKQTEDQPKQFDREHIFFYRKFWVFPPKQFKREYIWVFFRKFRVVSVCFGLLRNRSVCFGCFDIGSKHRNKPNFFVFGFTKQTETNAKPILFRFVSVRTEIYFCLFRGTLSQAHPQIAFSLKCIPAENIFFLLTK